MTNPNTPWAWLGLLKWSLSYTDGTVPSSEFPSPMSDEDKAFLESVMRDGIVDEGERMKTILRDLAEYLEQMKGRAEGGENAAVGTAEESKGDKRELEEEDLVELFLELRDIVEQIDYARAFAAMGGLQFLLGCASERDAVPRSIRSSCLGVLATLCQNNPPVQDSMLDHQAIPLLANLYFHEFPDSTSGEADECDGMLRSRIVQAMSCSIRGHAVAEQKFCAHDDGRRVIESGLGVHTEKETLPGPPLALRKRCLFFLHALVTSDNSDADRVKLFEPSIRHVACRFLDPSKEPEAEVREMGLGLLCMLIKQKKNEHAVVEMKDEIVRLGVRRVKEMRELQGEEREFASVELEHWESLIVELARADILTAQGGGGEGTLGDSLPPLLLS